MKKPIDHSATSYEHSNWIVRSLSIWIFTFYNKWKKEPKSEFVLSPFSRQDEADYLFQTFKRIQQEFAYQKYQFIPKVFLEQNRFFLTLMKTFGTETFIPFFLFFIQDCLIKPFQPILIGWIIRYFSSINNSYTQTDNGCWTIIIGLCLSSLLMIICHHPSMLFSLRLSMRVKIVWNTIIHNKCLKLSSNSPFNRNLSSILNLMTNQTRKFDEFFLLKYQLIIVPVQTILILFITYYYIGPTCLITFIIFILFAYFNLFLSQRFSTLRNRSTKYIEQRLKLLDETFKHLFSIKIFTLEQFFLEKIIQTRKLEISQLQIPLVGRSILLSFSMISSRVIMYLTFLLSLYLYGEQERFSMEVLLVSVTLFEKLRYSLIWTFPQAFSALIDIIFACQKMEQFLQEPDIINSTKKKLLVNDRCNPNCIVKIKNIHFKLKPGQTLTIIGSIGSGKTQILLSLLSEIQISKLHYFKLTGTIAYTSQENCCFNISIRENILFGREYRPNIYKKILELTSLDFDLAQLPFGDQTIVNDSGSNLSGGQKSRINLARALYSDADIYLLDDPFSSLDTELAKRIYEKCIQDYLKNKIIIMTTHHCNFINENGYLLILEPNGQLSFKKNSSQVSNCLLNIENKRNTLDIVKLKRMNPILQDTGFDGILTKQSNLFLNDIWKYLNRGSFGFGSIYIIILTSLGTQIFVHVCDHWLSLWETIFKTSTIFIHHFLLIYTFIILITIIFAVLRCYSFTKLCHYSSELLHNQTIENIIRAPILNISCGTLLNYFSKDFNVLDEILPATLFELNIALGQVISIIVIILFLDPCLAILTICYMFSLFTLLKKNIDLFQMIRKFELKTRNKIFSHLNPLINALPTIRAYQVENTFQNQFHKLLNDHTATVFLQNASSRFLCLLVDMFSLIYIILILISFQLFSWKIDGKLASLCLASMFNLIGMAQWACKRAVDSDFLINSYRNISIFDNLQPEIEKNKENWSNFLNANSEPVLEMNDLFVYYNKLSTLKSYVLKDVNICIGRKQKIGICGRSGSGKSTLINAILKMAFYEGQIRICGEYIENIPLRQLRRKILYIPQQPVIFEGTIRDNLNLFQPIQNEQRLWKVLDKVHLRILVESLSLKLDEPLSSIKLSTGQKQMLCLARIMLQYENYDCLLVILDEPTSNIDFEMDKQIQICIRNEFRHCAMIIITHRLDTILDCDRILVFDNGKLVENDHPKRLLSNKYSHFSKLMNTTNC